MLQMKIKAGRRSVAPAELHAVLGTERARERLADAIEALILQLDMIDGDPDLEETDTEDSFALSPAAVAIATNLPQGDVEQDAGAWTEWHTRGRRKDDPGTGKHGQLLHEDDEDADPREEDDDAGQCTEDEISSGAGWPYGVGVERGPGCSISDPGGVPSVAHASYGINQSEPLAWQPSNDVRARQPHRDRIRAARCDRVRLSHLGREYELRDYRVGVGVAADLI